MLSKVEDYALTDC